MRAPVGLRTAPFARLIAASAIALLAIAPRGAGADITPWEKPHWYSRGSHSHTREDWQEKRLVLGAAYGIPASFPSGWKPAVGIAIGLTFPVLPWCDVVADGEAFTHRFDASHLRAKGATAITASSASFSDIDIGARFHSPEFGRRFYGMFEVGLPDVSRPAVTWTDASGKHTQDGTEIFGADPGFVMGVGYELVEPRRIGGLFEIRFVVAPGSTKPSEYMVAYRGGIAIPLPF